MSSLVHRSPSVGSVVKKIIAINPNLDTQDVIRFVRESIYISGEGEFSSMEIIDEEKALEFARATLKN